MKIKPIKGCEETLEPGEHDLVLIATRNAGGIEIFAPDHDDMDLGQLALLSAAAMIATDKSMADMFVAWGKSHDIYRRSMAGEYDKR